VPDYLSQRQNVLTQDSTEKAELNTYLETVADKFGLRWLEQASGNPVQELWQAKHALATNEMLTLGHAVKNLAQAGPTWTRHQIAQMKTGSIGEQAGAAFELLGLSEIARRYNVDRVALARTLSRLAEDGLIACNQGHGWTFLPTLDSLVSLRASYEFRLTLEPSGFLLSTFKLDPVTIERMRLQHLTSRHRLRL
jgi:Bacterial regulatory proteins, gntR family